MFSQKQIYILSRWPWIPSPEHTETWEAKFHLIKDHEDITSTKDGGGLGGPTWFTLEIELLGAPRKIMVVNNHPISGRLFLGWNYGLGWGTLLRKPAGRLGVVSPCERSENKEGVWGRGVVDTGAFFGRNRRCLGWRFWVSGSRLYH